MTTEGVADRLNGQDDRLDDLVARVDDLCVSVGLKAQVAESLGELNDTRADRVTALAARLSELESQDWKGLMAHLHTMWHDLERRFDDLEEKVGTFHSKITLPRSSFALAKQERLDLAGRVEQLETSSDEPHKNKLS